MEETRGYQEEQEKSVGVRLASGRDSRYLGGILALR